MAQVVDQLPLSSLPLKEGDVPLGDLRTIADAAASDPDVRSTLMRRVDELLDCREAGDQDSFNDLTDLAVMGVFALAADRFDRAGRRDVAEFLIRVLFRAGELDDDWLLEAGERTAGRFGPDIIDPAMRLLQDKGSEAECWTYVCHVLKVAADADEAVKQGVAKYCRGVVRDAPDRFERFSSIDPALWVLAALNDVKSLPMLKDLQRTSKNTELKWTIKRLEGGQVDENDIVSQPWEDPVEEWLPHAVEDFRERQLENDEPEPNEAALEQRRLAGCEARGRQTEEWSPVTRPIERGVRKVGRNEPCPCGSGRKFKKCCGG